MVRQGRTEIGPVQGLVREPDLEPPAALLPVELDDRQARAVDRNRVPDVAVAQDGRGVPDRERAPARVMQDVRDGPEVLDLRYVCESVCRMHALAAGVSRTTVIYLCCAAYQTCEHLDGYV